MTEIFSSCVAVFKITQVKELKKKFSESTTLNLSSHAYVQI